jgi:arginine exporter protein ArgO
LAVSLTAITIGELWSPQTDAGVVVQVTITLAIVAGLVWLVRRENALVQLVLGVGMVVLAWYGLRALH